jgi:hypothetical protein
MILAPPVGLWMFRAFRLAHWPEPSARKAEAGPSAELS